MFKDWKRRWSIKPGTWNIPEHSGTFRNIPEHRIIITRRLQAFTRATVTGTVNVLSPRCSLLTKKGKLLSSKLLPVSIHHSIMMEGWAGEDHVPRELFLTHMEARGVHHVPSPVPAVLRQLSTTKMLFCFPKPALTKKSIYKPSPCFT